MKTVILLLFLIFGMAIGSPLETCLFKTCECVNENPNESEDLLSNGESSSDYDINCRVDEGALYGAFPERVNLPGYENIKIGVFDLSALGLKNIPDRAYENLNIQYLDLNGNELTLIKNVTFAGMMGNLAIDLTSNKIQFIEDDSFQHDSFSILNLKLEKNNLGKMSAESLSHVFRNLKSLTTLLLSDNGLNQMPNLKHMTNLRQLSLPRNQIEHIDNLPSSVTDLNLDHNRIKSLEATTLSELKSLKYLSLDSNQISHIDSHAFSNLVELVHLNLARNYIKHLPEKFIYNLINLDRLDLSSQNQMLNNISSFAFDRRSNQNFIKMIDLSGNRLNDFNNQAFCSKNSSNNYVNIVDLVLPDNMETEVNSCWFLHLSRGYHSAFDHPNNLPKVSFKKSRLIDRFDDQIKCGCHLDKSKLFVKLEGNCLENGQLISLDSYRCNVEFNKESVESYCDSMPEFDCTEKSAQKTTEKIITTTQIVELPQETDPIEVATPSQPIENSNKPTEKSSDKTNHLTTKESKEAKNHQANVQQPTKATILSSSNRMLGNKLLGVVSILLVSLLL
ncbi:unnamed protein product [Brachionus calyciflorus]|uniref:Uncharacterized protein n=1 Tax=Brachionus calyciflorus TaxID=104777 RepID=A0A813SGT0_9BILA|nr:unnamed protein product [Brachionus calyciflorus]